MHKEVVDAKSENWKLHVMLLILGGLFMLYFLNRYTRLEDKVSRLEQALKSERVDWHIIKQLENHQEAP